VLTIEFEHFCRDPKVLLDEMKKTGKPGLVRSNGSVDFLLKIQTYAAANDEHVHEKEFIDEFID
jgi:hypothetical protein